MENAVKAKNQTEVLIIGAGPAGLLLGYYLKKCSIDYLILEQGETVASSWTKMPDHLHLITLWKSNCLLKEDMPLFHPYKSHSAREFSEYLDQFSKRHQLKILTGNKVISTEKTGEAFSIFASSGLYQSRLLVDCRGYFNFPFIPEYDITGEPPKMLHFKDYKNRAQLNDHKNILVVGKRLSAGQVLMELAVGKRHNLFLSARGPIHFSSRSFVLKHFLRHLNIYEGIGKIFARKIKKEIEVPMNHNAKHLLKKDVAVVGDISKIVDKEVYFKDGGHEHIDAIIFATGFRPHPIHLKDDFESAETEGLFYLGRGSQRTFTSRFIRGIREDAPVLSHLILGKLASSKRSQ